MAPKYKLIYFNCKALAEPIRFLFSYGGIEFEDFRFENKNWPEYKPHMPFGMTPVLEVDGKVIHQSVAISRYLAKELDLAGSDNWEALQIDAIVDAITDFRLKIGDYYYDNNPESKERKREPVFKEIAPYFMKKLEETAKTNGGYLVNGKLTWADLFFASLIDYFNAMVERDLVEDCPTLKALRATVIELPGIKEWVAKRPVTVL